MRPVREQHGGRYEGRRIEPAGPCTVPVCPPAAARETLPVRTRRAPPLGPWYLDQEQHPNERTNPCLCLSICLCLSLPFSVRRCLSILNEILPSKTKECNTRHLSPKMSRVDAVPGSPDAGSADCAPRRGHGAAAAQVPMPRRCAPLLPPAPRRTGRLVTVEKATVSKYANTLSAHLTVFTKLFPRVRKYFPPPGVETSMASPCPSCSGNFPFL